MAAQDRDRSKGGALSAASADWGLAKRGARAVIEFMAVLLSLWRAQDSHHRASAAKPDLVNATFSPK